MEKHDICPSISEYSYHEILGFYINPVENHLASKNMLIDLDERSVEGLLIFIAECNLGIENRVMEHMNKGIRKCKDHRFT
ncbi:hypothetical protein [Thermoplasma acidophilum]|uniref:Uncharacterized protein n=1 Tax=Thermoplasma acidophilum (strain ATCC 25905 / DSM 1728 / JCM 9062 / NBRC 15155 / AMRC-C165) TaxID=273075 RepID=Q9HK90_THEAC|nr:transposase [Thermoplasma acidophilum]CAC11849.1 hypothetical protein [Thermoplasma acidophilum]